MFEMMVEQAKMSDEMYEKYGVDEEEFNSAVMYYNLQNDPEIMSLMMQNMKKLGLGGGMGMGGPTGGMMGM